MKTVVQSSLVIHARIVGDNSTREVVFAALGKHGWHVTRSGPQPLGGLAYSGTRFEILADRVLGEHDREVDVLHELENDLP